MATDGFGNQQYPGYQWDGFQGWVPEKGMNAAANTTAQAPGGQGSSPLDALAALFALGSQSGWQANTPNGPTPSPAANPAATAAVAAAAQPATNNLPSPMAPGARLPSRQGNPGVPVPPSRPENLGDVPIPPSREASGIDLPRIDGDPNAQTMSLPGNGFTPPNGVGMLPPQRPTDFGPNNRGWVDAGALENAMRNPPVVAVPMPPRRPEAIIAIPTGKADPGARENYYRGNGLPVGRR